MMGVHFIWINKVPYPTESISEQFLRIMTCPLLSGYQKVEIEKVKWMIDIEMNKII